MQNAKDSFYIALRNRLCVLNPERTIMLRGAARPGILVEEAEAPFAQTPSDVFVLRWAGQAADVDLASTLVAQEVEILYQTSGSQSYGGLDRGRVLSQLDGELLTLLQPFSTPKVSYVTQPPVNMSTQVFWDEPIFTPIVSQRDRLGRSARVTVYSYREPGLTPAQGE